MLCFASVRRVVEPGIGSRTLVFLVFAYKKQLPPREAGGAAGGMAGGGWVGTGQGIWFRLFYEPNRKYNVLLQQ